MKRIDVKNLNPNFYYDYKQGFDNSKSENRKKE